MDATLRGRNTAVSIEIEALESLSIGKASAVAYEAGIETIVAAALGPLISRERRGRFGIAVKSKPLICQGGKLMEIILKISARLA